MQEPASRAHVAPVAATYNQTGYSLSNGSRTGPCPLRGVSNRRGNLRISGDVSQSTGRLASTPPIRNRAQRPGQGQGHRRFVESTASPTTCSLRPLIRVPARCIGADPDLDVHLTPTGPSVSRCNRSRPRRRQLPQPVSQGRVIVSVQPADPTVEHGVGSGDCTMTSLRRSPSWAGSRTGAMWAGASSPCVGNNSPTDAPPASPPTPRATSSTPTATRTSSPGSSTPRSGSAAQSTTSSPASAPNSAPPHRQTRPPR
jgi:hypothetical protein